MKTGLDYFHFDVSFFSEKKIKRLRARYGNDGVMVYVYLLCEIYRNGYYIDYDDDLILDISDELNITENSTKQIMNYLLSRSLFDDTLAKSVKVLTAKSVQLRYQEAVRKRAAKRSSECIEVEEKFWVLKKEDTESFIKVCHFGETTANNDVFRANNSIIQEKNTQSKVKESKVNKSKVLLLSKQSENSDCTYSDKIDEIFDLHKKICISYPKISNKEKYLEELQTLLCQYDTESFKVVFEKLEKNSFFKGNNAENWKAAFGWVIKRKNFEKILSGFYDGRDNGNNSDVGKNNQQSDVDKYKVVIMLLLFSMQRRSGDMNLYAISRTVFLLTKKQNVSRTETTFLWELCAPRNIAPNGTVKVWMRLLKIFRNLLR